MLLSSPMSRTPFRLSTASPACWSPSCGGGGKHSSEGSSVSLLSSHGRAVCDQAALLAIRQNWLWLDGTFSDQSELLTIRHNWSQLDNWPGSGIKCSWSGSTPSDCLSQTAISECGQCSSVSHCSAAAHRLFCRFHHTNKTCLSDQPCRVWKCIPLNWKCCDWQSNGA